MLPGLFTVGLAKPAAHACLSGPRWFVQRCACPAAGEPRRQAGATTWRVPHKVHLRGGDVQLARHQPLGSDPLAAGAEENSSCPHSRRCLDILAGQHRRLRPNCGLLLRWPRLLL